VDTALEVYEKIKARRKELGLSADEVAVALGVSRATVYRYESAEIEKLPTTILEPLSKILHCSPSYLMGWDDYYSDEITELAHEMPKDELLMDLYFYWKQLSDIGKKKLIDNASDLAKIYIKN